MRQLSLDLKLADYALFETYHAGPNGGVVEALRHAAIEMGPQVHWVWGQSGSGRSHLLQAAVATAAAAGQRSAWLPLAADDMQPGMLEGMGALDLLCVDDVDRAAGHPEWERALFALFEELRSTGGRLVVSAGEPPGEAGFQLRDLGSRLASGPTWKLQPLSDADRLAALQLRSDWRGIKLPDETGEFLLRRVDRSNRALFALLDRLEAAALEQRRLLTVPFVRSVLNAEQGA